MPLVFQSQGLDPVHVLQNAHLILTFISPYEADAVMLQNATAFSGWRNIIRMFPSQNESHNFKLQTWTWILCHRHPD